MKIYIYYEDKWISGGMGGPEDHYHWAPQFYQSLDRLLTDHPNVKKDDAWATGEVYQEKETVD